MNLAAKQHNARKWTSEIVMKHLMEIETDATEGNTFFLGTGLKKRGLNRHLWAYWKKIFQENDDIIEKMLRIESTIECKLFEAALRNKIPAKLAMLSLRNHYNWKDKPDRLKEKRD